MSNAKTVNVLFELGVEELPASAIRSFTEALGYKTELPESMLVKPSEEQIDAFKKPKDESPWQSLTPKSKIDIHLKQRYAAPKDIQIYATPRRLAILIKGVNEYIYPFNQTILGPQEKVAFNDKGEPTQAGLGFARSNDIDPKKLKDYCENGRLTYNRTIPGCHISKLLPTILNDIINNLQDGRTMQWGSGTQKFVRPIRWVVLLVDDKKVEGEMFGLPIQDFTYGHRFLSPKEIKLKNADSYVEQLRKGKVMVDQKERRHHIIEALNTLPKKHHGTALIDEALVEEVTGLVEWPVPMMASFSPDFLHIPAEALISSMKQHQKSFPIFDANEKLLPYFIFISNLDSKNPEQVIRGNERVMQARLSDANFFFINDKQQPLADRLAALSSMVYQEKLGSLYDKTQRLVSLCQALGDAFQLNEHDAMRAAWLSLCDLTTSMVQEFPELQGVMGSHYANHDGETAVVCTALAEQYLPRFAGDRLPASLLGCTLSIAQRLDILVGQFGIGNKPTGDKDPFALRRNAQGLMRLLIEKKMDLDLKQWLLYTADLMPVAIKDKEALVNEIWQFCLDRLKAVYIDNGGHASYFAAVAALNITHPYDFVQRLDALKEFRALPAAAALIAAHKRVKNILSKVDLGKHLAVKKNLLKEAPEIELAEVLNKQQSLFEKLSKQRDYVALLKELAALRPYIDRFFDHVMVMVEDPALKENRLALLSQLRTLLESVAEIGELE